MSYTSPVAERKWYRNFAEPIWFFPSVVFSIILYRIIWQQWAMTHEVIHLLAGVLTGGMPCYLSPTLSGLSGGNETIVTIAPYLVLPALRSWIAHLALTKWRHWGLAAYMVTTMVMEATSIGISSDLHYIRRAHGFWARDLVVGLSLLIVMAGTVHALGTAVKLQLDEQKKRRYSLKRSSG